MNELKWETNSNRKKNEKYKLKMTDEIKILFIAPGYM